MRCTSIIRNSINTIGTLNVSRTIPVSTKLSTVSEPTVCHSNNILILSLTLPSRHEKCRFYVNLQTATVGQLINEIKQEDSGVEHVQIYDHNGTVLSKTNSIESLTHSTFTIELNRQKTYLFDAAHKLQIKNNSKQQTNYLEGPSTEDTVAALYHALNMMKVYHSKYIQLNKEADEIRIQLEPLEKIKSQIAELSQRYTTRCIWFGLAGMSFQIGMLMELTWNIYSWDIVEPISYFLAFGASMTFYATFLMTRSDFEYLTMSDRIFLLRFYREARGRLFDVSLYNRLKDRLYSLNTDIARLRAPLSLSLPIPTHAFRCKISGEELSPLDLYRKHGNSVPK